MKIRISHAAPEHRKPKPAHESKLGFGRVFTDHMFTLYYKSGQGWHNPAIEPYREFSLDPAAMGLHYSQLIFEGLKAYRGKTGSLYLFRPQDNLRRMSASAHRLCMPPLPEELVMEALRELVMLDREWVPRGEGTSLYIRPTMIATERALGVRPSDEYLFFIILCPVGPYYAEGFKPTKIYVEEEYVRAAPGGTGAIKAAANYAASLYATARAVEKGYTQVLWLDAVEKCYVEEVGTSNVFFKIGDELVTPLLGGTILPGITRDSVIRIAETWGIPVSERRITIDEVMEAAKTGRLQEAFASGTAAVVSPIGHLCYKGQEVAVNNDETGPLTLALYKEILQIQYGEKDDPFGWRIQLPD